MLSEGSNLDIWVYDSQRGGSQRLTTAAAVNAPVWSPDVRYLVFASATGMYWVRADGADNPQPFIRSNILQFPASSNADGTRLTFAELNPEGATLIRTVAVGGPPGRPQPGEPELFLKSSPSNPNPAISPNGRWMAYASMESGIYEVYVRPFSGAPSGSGIKRLISTNGGQLPTWSRNGHELFYRSEDHRIMVVNYTVKGDSFDTDRPRLWSEKQLANTGANQNFDLAPDGKRFVVLMPAEGPEPRETQNHLTLVVNFFDEVRRRVAAQGK
jgi:serine/threonine-protein kinase